MLDRAISEFQEAARLNPDNPAYKENLAKGRRMKEGGSGN
jgi:cytochrome c-type biogenesis protein CcmH/NrfG